MLQNLKKIPFVFNRFNTRHQSAFHRRFFGIIFSPSSSTFRRFFEFFQQLFDVPFDRFDSRFSLLGQQFDASRENFEIRLQLSRVESIETEKRGKRAENTTNAARRHFDDDETTTTTKKEGVIAFCKERGNSVEFSACCASHVKLLIVRKTTRSADYTKSTRANIHRDGETADYMLQSYSERIFTTWFPSSRVVFPSPLSPFPPRFSLFEFRRRRLSPFVPPPRTSLISHKCHRSSRNRSVFEASRGRGRGTRFARRLDRLGWLTSSRLPRGFS